MFASREHHKIITMYSNSGQSKMEMESLLFVDLHIFLEAVLILEEIHRQQRIYFCSLIIPYHQISNSGRGDRLEAFFDNLLVFTGNYNSECTQSSICGTSGYCWGDGSNKKIMLSGDYIMQESYFDNHDIICVSLKQTSTQSNPQIIQCYINDKYYGTQKWIKNKQVKTKLSSKSSNSVFSEAICNTLEFKRDKYFVIQGFITNQDNNCLDQNKDPFDGCFSGRYDCVQGFSNCIRGICIECQKGWLFDIQLQICEPICGDQMIINIEQCDDGNYLEYDGCFNCKFSCPLFCKQCEFGKCLECQSNYNLIDLKCEKINGNLDQKSQDNFLSQIYNFFRLCFQTHDIFGYQCGIKLIANCLHSLNDRCFECESFYQLSWNKKECIPKCNNGIVILYEFCDDQNNIQFDGCYKCQSSCQLECQQFIEQQCYICIDGWQMIDNRCYQICGDGQLAISSQEQCNDGNYNPYD
ncbi:unnamed protein product [Paramecium pentaurelia]|uniref:Uncharacterized protein n=1 Tax=Paramecium pentaurelia TaxID=43138 RepID=A0A8S1VY48_9CILI|nr:unnamed protein product [Paramecium pentaurelia]